MNLQPFVLLQHRVAEAEANTTKAIQLAANWEATAAQYGRNAEYWEGRARHAEEAMPPKDQPHDPSTSTQLVETYKRIHTLEAQLNTMRQDQTKLATMINGFQDEIAEMSKAMAVVQADRVFLAGQLIDVVVNLMEKQGWSIERVSALSPLLSSVVKGESAWVAKLTDMTSPSFGRDVTTSSESSVPEPSSTRPAKPPHSPPMGPFSTSLSI